MLGDLADEVRDDHQGPIPLRVLRLPGLAREHHAVQEQGYSSEILGSIAQRELGERNTADARLSFTTELPAAVRALAASRRYW